MKSSTLLVLILLLFCISGFAQKPNSLKKSPAKGKITKFTAPAAGNEKEEFEKAVAVPGDAERIAALQKFIENFPKSTEKTRAQELIVSARAAVGDEKLRTDETESGIEFFKAAVKDAPQPMSDKLSALVVSFPNTLFWRGERAAAAELAQMIEAKTDKNAKQLLALATFYIGTENAAEAKRLAEKSIALDEKLPAAHQTLGLAYRLNFELEESAAAYSKALELDQNSVVSKRSLAEMKRAVGKADEAAALYREILAKDAADAPAQTGLILALFGAEKRAEAETEMNRALEANANNLPLLVGAAYWYAAHGDGAKAVETAQKAVDIEPRYIWAHIALARGLIQQKRPVEAERTLLAARQYGNFPTLDYEIASARLESGFFRDAVEILKTRFTVAGDTVKTDLGGRVTREAASFTDLLAAERRASIFEPAAADDAANAARLKALLALSEKLDAANSDEQIAALAAEFVKGDDKMRFHRGLYAANLLLQKRKALPQALEFTRAAVGKTDDALDVASPAAAILADELYESRTVSISRNQFIIVPEVPRPALLAVLRGRIEELTGWILYQQNSPKEAVTHLKRAVSVLPEKSSYWRSGMWRLGMALETEGKDKEALDSYIKGYAANNPDGLKYVVIESLYKKLNGSAEGLEKRIGAKPASSVYAANSEKSESAPPNLPAETKNEATTANAETNTENVPTETPAETNSETKSETAPDALPKNVELNLPENSSETPTEIKTETTPETSEAEIPIKAETNAVESEKKTETVPDTAAVTEENRTPVESNEKAQNDSTSKSVEQVSEPVNQVSDAPDESSPKQQPETSPATTAVTNEQPEKPADETKNEKVKAETEAETKPEENQPNSPETAETPVKTAETPETTMQAAPAPQNTTPPAESIAPSVETPAETPAENRKSPFDPVVIRIPKAESSRLPNPRAGETPAKETENAPVEPEPKPIDEKISAGIARLRVVVEDKFTDRKMEECALTISQESISLLGGGGSLGVLVGIENTVDTKEIKAVSANPNDIEVTLEPEIGALSGRAFFVIKSISTRTGDYKVIFEAPCGKKEVAVRVR